jgi:hypothetical protein
LQGVDQVLKEKCHRAYSAVIQKSGLRALKPWPALEVLF